MRLRWRSRLALELSRLLAAFIGLLAGLSSISVCGLQPFLELGYFGQRLGTLCVCLRRLLLHAAGRLSELRILRGARVLMDLPLGVPMSLQSCHLST